MSNIASRVIYIFLHWAIDFSVNRFLIGIQMTYKLLFPLKAEYYLFIQYNAPRNPQKVDLCVLALSVAASTRKRRDARFDMWPA